MDEKVQQKESARSAESIQNDAYRKTIKDLEKEKKENKSKFLKI